jgi:hypothetical protein
VPASKKILTPKEVSYISQPRPALTRIATTSNGYAGSGVGTSVASRSTRINALQFQTKPQRETDLFLAHQRDDFLPVAVMIACPPQINSLKSAEQVRLSPSAQNCQRIAGQS